MEELLANKIMTASQKNVLVESVLLVAPMKAISVMDSTAVVIVSASLVLVWVNSALFAILLVLANCVHHKTAHKTQNVYQILVYKVSAHLVPALQSQLTVMATPVFKTQTACHAPV